MQVFDTETTSSTIQEMKMTQDSSHSRGKMPKESDNGFSGNALPLHGAHEQNEVKRESFPLSLLFVGFIVFVDVFVDFFVIIALNQYAYVDFQKTIFLNTTINVTERGKSHCYRGTNSTAFKMEQAVQEEVSGWSSYASLASGLPTIIMAPLLCSLSDIYGRKYCLLVSLFGNLLKNVLTYTGMIFALNI